MPLISQGKSQGWLSLDQSSFEPWASLQNVVLSDVRIEKSPDEQTKGLAVIAQNARAASRDDQKPIIKVPRDLILSQERVHNHAKYDRDFKLVLDAIGDFGRTPRGAILTFLLYQCSLSCPSSAPSFGVRSAFTDYVKFLPLGDLPTMWSEQDLLHARGTSLLPAVHAKLKSLQREFTNLQTCTADIAWCNAHWWTNVDNAVSFDDWLQVDAMYRSRALEYPDIGHCMVPCMDMANHQPGEATVAYYELDSDSDAVLLLHQHKFIAAGDEITITYGDEKGACEMFFSYGFLDRDMHSAKEIFLDLDFIPDDRLQKAKAQLVDLPPGVKLRVEESGITWHSDFVWLICVNEDDGLSIRIRKTIAGDQELVAFWGEEEIHLNKLVNVLQISKIWDVYQLRAVAVLQDRVASQLGELMNDDSPKPSTNASDGAKAATRLRELETDMLSAAYSHFEDQKIELADRPVVKAYLASMNDDEVGEAADVDHESRISEAADETEEDFA